MAVEYSRDQIRRIHSLRQAVNKQLYKSEDGIMYIGNHKGFLEKYKDIIGDVAGTTLGTSVERVGNYSTKGLMDKIDEIDEELALRVTTEEFEAYKKQAKCFTIAMSMVL